MKNKLGILDEEDKDLTLIQDLLSWMNAHKADYTKTFCYLMEQTTKNSEIYGGSSFVNWKVKWEDRLERSQRSKDEIIKMMRSVNPVVIPRNHKVEEVLRDSESKDDYSSLKRLLKFIKLPYSSQKGIDAYQEPSGMPYQEYKTFCGT